MSRRYFTEEEKERSLEYARKGMPSRMIAEAVGCKNNTLRKWCADAGVSLRVTASEYQEEMMRLRMSANEIWTFCIEWDDARMKVREAKGW